MSEGDWSSEAASPELAAPPRRRIPLWVWGCGGGCGLFLLVGVIALVFGAKKFKQLVDPEKNWAAIDAFLPVIERPEGYIVFASPVDVDGVSSWLLTSTVKDDQHQIILMHGAGGDGTDESKRELFGEHTTSRPDVQAGTLVAQGRELTCLRGRSMPQEAIEGSWLKSLAKVADGSMLILDLSPPGGKELIGLTYTKQGARDPVSDAEILAFLDHFRIPGANAPPTQPAEAPALQPAGAQEEHK